MLMGVSNGYSLRVLTLTGSVGVQRGLPTEKLLLSQLLSQRKDCVLYFGASRSATGRCVKSIHHRTLLAAWAGCPMGVVFWRQSLKSAVGKSGSSPFQRDNRSVSRTT